METPTCLLCWSEIEDEADPCSHCAEGCFHPCCLSEFYWKVPLLRCPLCWPASSSSLPIVLPEPNILCLYKWVVVCESSEKASRTTYSWNDKSVPKPLFQKMWDDFVRSEVSFHSHLQKTSNKSVALFLLLKDNPRVKASLSFERLTREWRTTLSYSRFTPVL